MNKPCTLLFVGPPGSGKGTQASFAAELLDWPHIDMGSLLRSRAHRTDPVSSQIAKTMQAGGILPSKLVSQILDDELASYGSQKGIILDGFARRLEQAEHLLLLQKEEKIAPLLMVDLDVPTAYIEERLHQRRYCQSCQHKSYLVTSTDTAVSCVRCGGHLVKRADDDTKVIQERLHSFNRITKPAIRYLSEHVPTIKIDGRGTIEEVNHELQQALTQHGLN